MISGSDLIVLTETKLDDMDEMWINQFCGELGYVAYINNRKKMAVMRSGGIAILIKKIMIPHVRWTRKPNDIAIWVKLDKIVINSDKDVIIGGVYIPPETSTYGGIHLFDVLEEQLLLPEFNDSHICLCGDFNAHARSAPNYSYIDTQLFDDLNLYDLGIECNEGVNLLNGHGLLKRLSKDTHMNNYGYRLLDLCRSHSLFIVNGRVGHDRYVGDYTCIKGVNHHVVDYCIASHDFLVHTLSDFKVMDFDKLYSDVHCPIKATMCKGIINENIVEQRPFLNQTGKIKWDAAKINDFIESLDNSDLANIENKLIAGVIDPNEANESICDTIKESARNVMGTYSNQGRNRRVPNNKRPITGECRERRRD